MTGIDLSPSPGSLHVAFHTVPDAGGLNILVPGKLRFANIIIFLKYSREKTMRVSLITLKLITKCFEKHRQPVSICYIYYTL